MLNTHFLNKKVLLGILLLQLLLPELLYYMYLMYSTLQYTMYLKLILHQNFPHFPIQLKQLRLLFATAIKKGSFYVLCPLLTTTKLHLVLKEQQSSYFCPTTNCTLHYIRWHLECNFQHTNVYFYYYCHKCFYYFNAFTTPSGKQLNLKIAICSEK